MGWFTKKPTQAEIDEQVRSLFNTCVKTFTAAWKDISKPAPTPEHLAGAIEEFAAAVTGSLYKHFPVMKEAPPKFIWMAVLTAVEEARTHEEAQLEKAFALLRAKYAVPHSTHD
jgi:hypothetical protein